MADLSAASSHGDKHSGENDFSYTDSTGPPSASASIGSLTTAEADKVCLARCFAAARRVFDRTGRPRWRSHTTPSSGSVRQQVTARRWGRWVDTFSPAMARLRRWRLLGTTGFGETRSNVGHDAPADHAHAARR
jgi:hypothetical protein